jgi:hypothetical protein
MLDVDPPATAGGTDRVQVHLATCEVELSFPVKTDSYADFLPV